MNLNISVISKEVISSSIFEILKSCKNGNVNLIVDVKSDEFLSDEFNKFAQCCRECGVKYLKIEIELTRSFDEYDIEKYVEKILMIKPDEFHIKQATEFKRPWYRILKEVQGALEHFATLRGENITEGYQVFDFGTTKIMYDYIPV